VLLGGQNRYHEVGACRHLHSTTAWWQQAVLVVMLLRLQREV